MNHLNPSFDSYRHNLIHTPVKRWERDVELLLHKQFNNNPIKFSIVTPIHDQEDFVGTQFSSILTHTQGNYEAIVILDGCTDRTKERLLACIENTPIPKNLSSITIFESHSSMFETSADNLGFAKARGEILIEIQADMEILTAGYNIILATPLKIYDDLIAISGRCCHGINANSLGFTIGKVGKKVEFPHDSLRHFDNYNAVFLSHTVNRGPLAIDKQKIIELGYLDEFHYCLGNDDHDLFLRAWTEKQWRTGFVPVEFHSPLERGSTRKERPHKTQYELEQRKKQEKEGYYSIHYKTTTYPSSETRRPSYTQRIEAIKSLN
jgi:glycosyltransferase involved in cell wall biosynthesis|uniref:glycosyltransferase family 2 protein n=1 Tax=Cyanobium sp. TaxID=2164130 RepID=UPI00404793A1